MAYVPIIPGVPPLLNGAIAATAVTLLTTDLISISSINASSQWGIFLNGSPVVLADTVTTFDYKKESILSDYPLEGGKLESYNKVSTPYEAEITLCAGGNDVNREAFLASIEAILDDFNLYDVVSPERVYPSCNVMRSHYRRTATNGRGVLSVPVRLRQIRVSTANSGTATAQPDGANAVNGGSVQTSTPSSAQTAAATSIQ